MHPLRENVGDPRGRLEDQVAKLLPTPTVTQGRNATSGRSDTAKPAHGGWTLQDVFFADRWGVYADAIRRWEKVSGVEAPEPAVVSEKTGRRHLNARLVEWMMDVPSGHVTDTPGLSQAGQLSLLGDGVVPAQGAAAFRHLLSALGA